MFFWAKTLINNEDVVPQDIKYRFPVSQSKPRAAAVQSSSQTYESKLDGTTATDNMPTNSEKTLDQAAPSLDYIDLMSDTKHFLGKLNEASHEHSVVS